MNPLMASSSRRIQKATDSKQKFDLSSEALPLEVERLIWRHALNEPRLILIKKFYRPGASHVDTTREPHIRAKCRTSSTLRVSRNSRTEAKHILQPLQQSVPGREHENVLINPQRDIIWIDYDRFTALTFLEVFALVVNPKIQIRRLALPWRILDPILHSVRYEGTRKLLESDAKRVFRILANLGVEELFIIVAAEHGPLAYEGQALIAEPTTNLDAVEHQVLFEHFLKRLSLDYSDDWPEIEQSFNEWFANAMQGFLDNSDSNGLAGSKFLTWNRPTCFFREVKPFREGDENIDGEIVGFNFPK